MQRKTIKLLLSIGSVLILGSMVIVEIISIRNAQIVQEVQQQEDAQEELKIAVGLWELKEPFFFTGEPFVATPSANLTIEEEATSPADNR